MNRLDEPAAKYGLDHYVDRAETWLRSNFLPVADVGLAFYVACLGVGDVPYVLPNPAQGVIPSVGLAEIGQGRPPAPRWHEIAAGTASLLPATKVEPASRGSNQSVYDLRGPRAVG